MAHHIEGKVLYLRSCEPVKFYNSLLSSVKEALASGFKVKIMFSGPETMVSHEFEGSEIEKKKAAIITDAIAYWSKMIINASGKSKEENSAAEERIAKSLGDEVLEHV